MTDALAKAARDIETVTAGVARLTEELAGAEPLTGGREWDRTSAYLTMQYIEDERSLPGLIGKEGSYDSRAEIEAASGQALQSALEAVEAKARIIKREQRRRRSLAAAE